MCGFSQSINEDFDLDLGCLSVSVGVLVKLNSKAERLQGGPRKMQDSRLREVYNKYSREVPVVGSDNSYSIMVLLCGPPESLMLLGVWLMAISLDMVTKEKTLTAYIAYADRRHAKDRAKPQNS